MAERDVGVEDGRGPPVLHGRGQRAVLKEEDQLEGQQDRQPEGHQGHEGQDKDLGCRVVQPRVPDEPVDGGEVADQVQPAGEKSPTHGQIDSGITFTAGKRHAAG